MDCRSERRKGPKGSREREHMVRGIENITRKNADEQSQMGREREECIIGVEEE